MSTALIRRPHPRDPYQFPYTLTLRHFLVRFKMGSMFPISAINEVCEQIYEANPKFRELRLPYAVWVAILQKEMYRR